MGPIFAAVLIKTRIISVTCYCRNCPDVVSAFTTCPEKIPPASFTGHCKGPPGGRPNIPNESPEDSPKVMANNCEFNLSTLAPFIYEI